MSIPLRTESLTVTFTSEDGKQTHALGPVSVEIPAGQFVCLIGPSGCGKSTLARVFAGLQVPTTGTAFIGEALVAGPSPQAGLMFQQANLMPWRTVQDNIVLPLELAGLGKEARLDRAAELLDMLKLGDFATAYPGALSGGMAQRAALGRLLAQGPEVLLLDEPFGALDAMTREKISTDLLRVWEQGQQTVLMVTHDINEAVFLADRVLVMSARPGQIAADIPVDLPRPRTLDDQYDSAFTRIARRVRSAIRE